MPGEQEMDAISENAMLGGRVRLLQPRRGYRAGLDAALLATACDAPAGARVLEAGCGAGAVLLGAAALRPGAIFTGVERDADAAALARRNVELNGLADRVQVVEADVERPFRSLGLAPFDAVLTNPPFFDGEASLRAPAPEKRGAWIAEAGFAAWAEFLSKALREGGGLTLIHRADRLADILAALSPKLGSFQIRPVHPYAEAPAKRVLVRAVKTGRAPLKLLAPLVLHAKQGATWTPQADAILKGQAPLGWE